MRFEKTLRSFCLMFREEVNNCFKSFKSDNEADIEAYHRTRSTAVVFIPVYGVAQEGHLFPAVSAVSCFRRTIAMETIMPALMLASHSLAVKILPSLSFVI